MTFRLTKRKPANALFFGILLWAFLLASASKAQTCQGTLGGISGVVSEIPVRVLVEGAPAYGSETVVAPAMRLPFDTSLMLTEVRRGRAKTYNPSGSGSPLWLDLNDLLCRAQPLRDNGKGPELKFFIRAPVSVRTDSPPQVASYRGPDVPRIEPSRLASDCALPMCQSLSRGSGLFIFSRMKVEQAGRSYERLLVGPFQSLNSNGARLLGWVDTEDGFVWATAYGIRPAENLRYEAGAKAGKERPICAYQTTGTDDLKGNDICIPILGGARWFNIPVRIPVLSSIKDETGRPQKYRVVLNVAGRALDGDDTSNINVQTLFSPENMNEQGNSAVESFASLKKTDIMFVIDGTNSMRAHMDAVRSKQNGAITRVATELQKRVPHLQSHYRFAALIYRDSAAGNSEFEYFDFPSSCEGPSGADTLIENLSVVPADDLGSDDDFAENSYGGLLRGLRYLRTNCPDNNKIFIVIGDHGYDAAAQTKKGKEAISQEQIINLIKGNINSGLKPIVPIFIQTPPNEAQFANPLLYRESYQLFTTQAQSIVGSAISERQGARLSLRLDSTALAKEVLGIVSAYSDSSAVPHSNRNMH